MSSESDYNFRWDNYLQHIAHCFECYRTNNRLTDVTIVCEGKEVYAHKILLSICSSYFRKIFENNKNQHHIIVFENVKFIDLQNIIKFIYCGDIRVPEEYADSFYATAVLLDLHGISCGPENEETSSDYQTEICGDHALRRTASAVESSVRVNGLQKKSKSKNLSIHTVRLNEGTEIELKDKLNNVEQETCRPIDKVVSREEIVERNNHPQECCNVKQVKPPPPTPHVSVSCAPPLSPEENTSFLYNFSQFPFKDYDKLDKYSRMVQVDPTKESFLRKKLDGIGGRNVIDCINLMMDFILDPDITKTSSWKGSANFKRLSDIYILRITTYEVVQYKWHPLTPHTFENGVLTWIYQSRHRTRKQDRYKIF